MLNTSKGPAVYSLRAQADRKKYQNGNEKHTLERSTRILMSKTSLKLVDIDVENGKVTGVVD